MSIEPVFTAHPTESTRRTTLRKQQRIAQDLLDRLNPGLDGRGTRRRSGRACASRSPRSGRPRSIRARSLTVADEREHVLFYLIDILYRVVPHVLRGSRGGAGRGLRRAARIARSCRISCDSAPGSAATWRATSDVHGKAIRETLQRHRQVIVSTYFEECRQLAESLSQSANRVADERSAGRAHRGLYRDAAGGAGADALRATIGCRTASSSGKSANGSRRPTRARPNAYAERRGIARRHRSSPPTAWCRIAAGTPDIFSCAACMRRVRTFGFHLAALDITQFARVHDEIIAQGIGDAAMAGAAAGAAAARNCATCSPATKDRRRPLDAVGRRACGCSRRLRTRATSSALAPIGEYIVSGAEGPEDVLAVLLLARWADVVDKRTGECALDVAPLLESMSALENAGGILRGLLREPAYRSHLRARGNRQIVRDRLFGMQQAERHRGLALGDAKWRKSGCSRRRGTPASRSRCSTRAAARRRAAAGAPNTWSRAAPAGTIRGVLRLTEQGEVVNQSYGLRPIAMRTLERTLRGRGARRARTHAAPAAAALARRARGRDAHDRRPQPRCVSGPRVRRRAILRVFPRGDAARCDRAHAHRFRASSRGGDGIGALRPIPGCSRGRRAATCCRAGSASAAASRRRSSAHGAAELGAMAVEWPFFAHLLDDVEAMLARTDLDLAAHLRRAGRRALRIRARPRSAREYAAHRAPGAAAARLRSIARPRPDLAALDPDCATPMSIPCISCRSIC